MKEPVRGLLAVNAAQVHSRDLDSQPLQAYMAPKGFKDFSKTCYQSQNKQSQQILFRTLLPLYEIFFFFLNAKSESKRVLNKITKKKAFYWL